MTDREVEGIGTEFGRYPRRYRARFGQDRTAAHFDTYCRVLLSDLPRKCVEPIALAAGTAVQALGGNVDMTAQAIGVSPHLLSGRPEGAQLRRGFRPGCGGAAAEGHVTVYAHCLPGDDGRLADGLSRQIG